MLTESVGTVSLGARLTILLLGLIRRKRIYASAAGLMRGIEQTRRTGPARPTRRQHAALRIEQETCMGQDVYRLSPQQTKETAQGRVRVMYLHGGAYVRPITRFHWQMLGALVEASGCEFVVPLYPLAPESSGLRALDFVGEVYRREVVQGTAMLLMGDSAGAGLAVALAAAQRGSAQHAPRHLILITPWVDVELRNPGSAAIADSDPMLAIDGLREAGRLYAGALPTSHPAISPVRANLANLPPMSIFAASRDVIFPDVMAFVQKATSSGVSVDVHVAPGMIHAWPLLGFIAEARRARAEIVTHIHRAFARDRIR